MKNIMSGLIPVLLFMCVCLTQRLVAQSSVVVHVQIAEADIINAGSLFDPMADRVKDLAPSAFSLRFINTTSPQQDVWVRMHLEAYATLDADRQRRLLYTMDSRQPFLVPKEGRVFTSADSRGSGDMEFISVSNAANIQRLKDMIWDPASGGRVPSGTYELVPTVTVVKIGTRDVEEHVPVTIRPVIVSNPTIAALIVPSENGYQYPTPFPQFQWTYDTRSVTLAVTELRPGQSIEDAAQSSDKYIEVTIDRQQSGGASIFTYPQSAAPLPGIDIVQGPRPLERGRSYVLALGGRRDAFGATVEPLRMLRSFTIDDPRRRTGPTSYFSIFTGTEYQGIAEMLQRRNFEIDPAGITLNNGAITIDQLTAFLNANRQRNITFTIEE